MKRFTDSEHLRTAQYANSANLSARIRIHELYSTEAQPLNEWLFDLMLEHTPQNARVLEIGTGTGKLWLENKNRIPAGWDITLTDFSAGMLDDAKHNLEGMDFTYQVVDIQDIPFEDNSFDLVLANFMLYHVPDRVKALAEVRRVLKPDGVFHSATLGKDHMLEIHQLVADILNDSTWVKERDTRPFPLETAADELHTAFSDVQMLAYDCNLQVTDVDPIVDYVNSMTRLDQPLEDHMDTLKQVVREQIDQQGSFFIRKQTGTFISRGGKA